MNGTAETPDQLRSLQLVWLSFAGAVVVLTFVVPLLAAGMRSTVPAALPTALAFAAGIAGLTGAVAIDRALEMSPPPDERAAVSELRSRLVLQLAIAEAPMLLGVVLAFVTGPPWVTVAAAAPALVTLLLVRPTPRRLDRFDASWRAAGSDVSLRQALLQATDRPPEDYP